MAGSQSAAGVNRPSASTQILSELAQLRPGTTLCPGVLAQRLGTTLAELRPVYGELAAAGLIQVTQGGRPADLRTLRGPFRVALPARASERST